MMRQLLALAATVFVLEMLIKYLSINTCKPYISGKFNLLRTKIWKNVKKAHGLEKACTIFPKTYILPEDLADFKHDYKNGGKKKEYIAKTLFSGSGVGVDLYDDATMRHELASGKYAIIQEYIKNPLLIHGYKFNIRFYMVVDCRQGIYLYKHSFNKFAEKPFNYHSKDRDSKINQANPDDTIYVEKCLPQSINDKNNFNIPCDKILNRLAANLKLIINCSESFCVENKKTNCLQKTHNFYGVDVEILNNFTPLIIEINSNANIDFPNVPWKNKLTLEMQEKVNVGNYDRLNWIAIQNWSK